MANEEQLAILRQGVEVWNKWRAENIDIEIDLTGAMLSQANLSHILLGRANLTGANFSGAILSRANLMEANLSGANFREAQLWGTDLMDANLRQADLRRASLYRASFFGADLNEADLGEADLEAVDLSYATLKGANLNGTNLRAALLLNTTVDGAKVSGSKVYGISVWDLKGEFEEQKDLDISNTPFLKNRLITIFDRYKASGITVDNLEVAQFIYLILNNKKVRDVINTLTSKSVLILGRFAISERKAILDALRNKLREYNLLPIVFDFDRPTDKDFTETIKTLAGISYFVIADITNPKSTPLELQATVPDYQIPFVPIIQEGESPFAMMVDLQKKYPWVLPTKSYDSIETLMQALKPGIIDPAVAMRNKLRLIKAQEQTTESLRDYLDKTL